MAVGMRWRGGASLERRVEHEIANRFRRFVQTMPCTCGKPLKSLGMKCCETSASIALKPHEVAPPCAQIQENFFRFRRTPPYTQA